MILFMALPRNPALSLYERLSAWSKTITGKSTLATRAITGRTWHEVHLETLDWILEVQQYLEAEAAIAGDEETGDIAIFVHELYKAVFVVDHALGTSIATDRTHIAPSTLRQLKQIARSWRSPEPSPEVVAELLETAQDAQKLIMSSTHLDDEAQRYLHELVAHLIKAIGEIEISGVSAVRHLSNELAGAIVVYFTDQGEDSEEVKRVFTRLVRGLQGLFVSYLAPAAIGAGMDSLIAQILP